MKSNGKMPKNDRQTLETIKFSLEVRERQNKFEIIKGVRKIPMGLSILQSDSENYSFKAQ